MKKVLLIGACLSALALAGCGEDDARRVIEAHGFRNPKLTGTPWFGCGESDSVLYNQSFTAIGPGDKPVSGVACGGALKGWTVRLR